MHRGKAGVLIGWLLLAGMPMTAWGHAQHRQFAGDGENQPDSWVVGIRQASAEMAGLVETAPARAGERAVTLTTDGRVRAHPAQIQEVNANTSGEVRDLWVRPGQAVRKGEGLASIYSPQFILQQKQHLALLESGEQREQIRAYGNLDSYMEDARQNLEWWGLTAEEVEQLEEKREVVRQTLNFYAPFDGIVTEVMVRPGELINVGGGKDMGEFVVTGAPIARMVAFEDLWVEARAFSRSLGRLEAGQRAKVRWGQGPDAPRYEGEVALVRPMVAKDNRGRFFVRLEDVPKYIGLGDPVTVRVELERSNGVWVPRDALMNAGGKRPYLFVQRQKDVFERRVVEVGDRAGDRVQIIDGVSQGEPVVVGGAYLLEGRRLTTGSPGGDMHH
jgi:RND family efflux transporter MFP subunit